MQPHLEAGRLGSHPAGAPGPVGLAGNAVNAGCPSCPVSHRGAQGPHMEGGTDRHPRSPTDILTRMGPRVTRGEAWSALTEGRLPGVALPISPEDRQPPCPWSAVTGGRRPVFRAWGLGPAGGHSEQGVWRAPGPSTHFPVGLPSFRTSQCSLAASHPPPAATLRRPSLTRSGQCGCEGGDALFPPGRFGMAGSVGARGRMGVTLGTHSGRQRGGWGTPDLTA